MSVMRWRLGGVVFCLALAGCPPAAPTPATPASAPVVELRATEPSAAAPATCRNDDEAGCRELCRANDADSCARLGAIVLDRHQPPATHQWHRPPIHSNDPAVKTAPTAQP